MKQYIYFKMFLKDLILVYMWREGWGLCTCMQCPRNPEESIRSLELELQAVVNHTVCMLRIKLGFFVRRVSSC